MGGGINDHVRRNAAYRLGYALQIGEIAAVFRAAHIQRDHLAQWCKTALQFPAYLAVFTEQQYLHQARPA
jgi:hypothetical protein